MKPLDLLVLLLLFKNQQRRKVVESLIKNKIRAGIFTEDLVISTFQKHMAPLKQHTVPVLGLAESLLECSVDIVVNFTKQVYSSAFMMGVYCQQEVVGDLVAKVGAGGGGDITKGAIDVLDQLSKQHTEVLSKYGLFLTAVLDHKERMSLGQVRKLMGILARLAWVAGKDGVVIQDDITIVIKKQIDSSHLTLKRMGVIGAVVVVQAMVKAHSDDEEERHYPQHWTILRTLTPCLLLSPPGWMMKTS